MRDRILAPRLLVLMMAPLLVACSTQAVDDFFFPTLPQCDFPYQLLSTDKGGYIICKDPPAGLQTLQDCKKYSQALTSDGKSMSCDERNTESQASRDALNHLESTEALLDAHVERLGKLVPPPRAAYCGQTANQPSAAFLSGTSRGIAAAAALCASVANCKSGAHMCSVYEMYESLVNNGGGALPSVGKFWVYMAAWSQEFSDNSSLQKEPGAGLADNCGGFTVGDSSKKWYGAAMSFAPTSTGDKALKFFGGPPNVGVPGTTSILANANAVLCNAVLPIACCR